MKDIMLNRRNFVALGLGSALAGLAGCAGGSDSAAPAADDGEEAGEPTSIDAEAFDALVGGYDVADDATIAASEWASAVKAAGVLKVGGTQTSQLFSLLNEVDGRTRGFDAGLYQMLAKYILGDDMAYEVTLVQSSTREEVLTTGQVDAVFATYTINDKRKEVIDFAGPYFVGHQGILVKADNTDINSVDDLAGKTVGVQEGSNGRAVMEEFAPEANVEELGTDEELRTALEQGRIDAYVVDATLHMGSMVANPGKYRMAAEFGPEDPLGIGLPKGSDGVDFVNAFLEDVASSGTWKDLYKICIADRADIADVPNPPSIGA